MCGLAFTFPMLLGARVMQGVVGAPMIQLSQSIITGLGLLVPGVWGCTRNARWPICGGSSCR